MSAQLEIEGTEYLFKIAETFELRTRGLVVVSPPNCLYKLEDWKNEDVLLRRPDGSSLRNIAQLEIPSPNEKQIAAVSLPGLSKRDVPIGTEVYRQQKWQWYSNVISLFPAKEEGLMHENHAFVSVREKLSLLGLEPPHGAMILPRNFETEPDVKKFLFEATSPLMSKLWTQRGVRASKINEYFKGSHRYVEARYSRWQSPVLFFPAEFRREEPTECTRSIVVLCEYLDAKYKEEDLRLRLCTVIEKDDGQCECLVFEGTVREASDWAHGLFEGADRLGQA
jgi:hypothetical protein